MPTICDPNPSARARVLRADLDIVSAVLRKAGAEAEMTEHGSPASHTIALTASVCGTASEAKALSVILTRLADETIGFLYGTMKEPGDDAEAEYRAVVVYQIVRPRPPSTRRRRSSPAKLAA